MDYAEIRKQERDATIARNRESITNLESVLPHIHGADALAALNAAVRHWSEYPHDPFPAPLVFGFLQACMERGRAWAEAADR